MSHHNNTVNIYGHSWTAPNYQIAENWREFLNSRSFSLETEDTMRANNTYVDVVYKLTKQQPRGVDQITAGMPVVATGEIIDGKMVVETWAEDNYSVWTEVPSGTHIVGHFDPYPIFGLTTTTIWFSETGGTPADGGPVVDPDDSDVAYLHGPMLTQGYISGTAMGFNWNEHFFQPGMPTYNGYRGTEHNYAADDSWYPTSNNSGMTFIGPTPGQPTNPARGAFYFSGPYTV